MFSWLKRFFSQNTQPASTEIELTNLRPDNYVPADLAEIRLELETEIINRALSAEVAQLHSLFLARALPIITKLDFSKVDLNSLSPEKWKQFLVALKQPQVSRSLSQLYIHATTSFARKKDLLSLFWTPFVFQNIPASSLQVLAARQVVLAKLQDPQIKLNHLPKLVLQYIEQVSSCLKSIVSEDPPADGGNSEDVAAIEGLGLREKNLLINGEVSEEEQPLTIITYQPELPLIFQRSESYRLAEAFLDRSNDILRNLLSTEALFPESHINLSHLASTFRQNFTQKQGPYYGEFPRGWRPQPTKSSWTPSRARTLLLQDIPKYIKPAATTSEPFASKSNRSKPLLKSKL